MLTKSGGKNFNKSFYNFYNYLCEKLLCSNPNKKINANGTFAQTIYSKSSV